MAAEQEVRAFVALELDAALHERLARLVEDLRPRLPGLRFTPVGNAHLTLRFLGTTQPRALETHRGGAGAGGGRRARGRGAAHGPRPLPATRRAARSSGSASTCPRRC